MLFAHLKRILKLDRLRLRGPNGARDEFHLAATVQNLRKLAKLIPIPSPIAATRGDAALTGEAATPRSPRRDYFKPDFFNGIGHEEQFPPARLSACLAFSEETFARPHGNGQERRNRPLVGQAGRGG
jgi:hypothetical protein